MVMTSDLLLISQSSTGLPDFSWNSIPKQKKYTKKRENNTEWPLKY
jgi:hypothetical protein